MPRRWLGWLGFMVCAALLAWQAVRGYWVRRELNPIARGKLLASSLGCFGCHGAEAGRGVPNPGSATGKVPAFKSETLMMDVDGLEDVRGYILDGFPAARKDSNAWRQAQAASLRMPAYRDLLDEGELADLVAYYAAVNGIAELPEPARAGRKLALSLGCFNCHGIDGAGGLPNPGSFKGYVPGWQGADFAELVLDERELLEWIRKGRLERLAKSVLARPFVEGQKIRMPPYESLLTEAQTQDLLLYFRWLRPDLR